MNKVAEKFYELGQKKRKVLIPFIVAGDPDLTATFAILPRLVQGGADLIELGVPFSDPLADGPVIQAASQRALAKGFRLKRFLPMLAENRPRVTVPLVLLVYYNLVYQYGTERFLQEAAESGINGLVIPDLPYEEAERLCGPAQKNGIALNMLVAPTSSPQRIRIAAGLTSGFIYLVSVRGVTGERAVLPPNLSKLAGEVKKLTALPVAIGFGVSRPEQAGQIASFADGIIVGSALVKKIAGGSRAAAGEEAEAFLQSFRKAVDG